MKEPPKTPSPSSAHPVSEREKNSGAGQTGAPKPVAQWVQPDTLKRLISTVRTL